MRISARRIPETFSAKSARSASVPFSPISAREIRFPSSTPGWSNGSTPAHVPAIAVTHSQKWRNAPTCSSSRFPISIRTMGRPAPHSAPIVPSNSASKRSRSGRPPSIAMSGANPAFGTFPFSLPVIHRTKVNTLSAGPSW